MNKKKENEKKLIFVVEDEPDIQELISINLKKSGYVPSPQ